MINGVDVNIAALADFGQQMSETAENVSRAFQPESNVNVAEEFANMTIIEYGHSANLKMLETAGQMMKNIIDIMA
ncbi:MAG: hypothetical protein K9L30_08910 [Desulfobacterales bacterium]|nr:hypothetical protein [Desulfobacterales bacterium]